MAIYYVSSTGSNSSNGSAGSPFATLQHAANMVKAGDTVVVKAGTYTGFNLTTSGTAGARITFTAEEGVVINRENSFTGRDGINLEGASFITIQGFTVEGVARAGIRSVTNDGVIISDNITQDNGRWGIFTGFSENVLIEGNIASGSGDEHGIYVSNSADNPTVRNNIVFGNYASGIQLNADAEMGGDGIITGARIENNIIYDNGTGGGAALNLDGVQNSIIANNLLYGNHSTGIALFRINAAQGSKNNTIANNTIVVAEDGRWAIRLRDGSNGNKLQHNILLTEHNWRGSIDISPDSLPGFSSNHNLLHGRFTTDDASSVLTLAQWRAQTGQDGSSSVKTISELFVNPGQDNYRLKDGAYAGYGVDFAALESGTPSTPTEPPVLPPVIPSDIITGSAGHDVLNGGANAETLLGNAGNDRINAGGGNDIVRGGEGNDTLLGNAGNDHLNGNQGNDVVQGNAGNDTVLGGKGNDTVRGGQDNDSVNGNMGNDVVYGDAGNDTLRGGKDNDTLIGGAGADELWGDLGADVILYHHRSDSTDTAMDTVGGFEIGVDRLDISALDISFSALTISYHAATQMTIIDHNGSTFAVALRGNITLTVDDFIL